MTEGDNGVRSRIPADESAGTAVVRAVAAYTNRPPAELEPLHDVVDVDALNALLAHDGDCSVQFRYADCLVDVSSDEIAVE